MYFDPAENTVHPLGVIIYWLCVAGGLTFLVMSISLLNLLITRGVSGLKIFVDEVGSIAKDVFSLSPRRVWALTRLTYTEAYRRKALSVFVVFGLLFMFAGWFMGDSRKINPDQVKVYISFVLTAVSWLTLPVVLILCCYGIPEDIRLRSIHTVVTKPARRLEIILGRMIGISMIGMLVLLAMSVVGYIWIVRQTPVDSQKLLTCRVPIYGGIQFVSREGELGAAGVNVGDIWTFRSYIEGASKARARWRFPNVNESMLDSEGNLQLENTFAAFRTHKGNMKQTLLYDIKLYLPDNPELSYTTSPQPTKEFRSKLDLIPRKLTVNDVQYDLIKDFVSKDGYLYVEISCIDREQYIGMSRSDLFIRMPDRPFWVGYWKAIFGIAMTIVLVSMLGVTASAIVKAPIAMVLTAVLYLLSGRNSHSFMDQLVSGQFLGGGVLESIYRIFTHVGPMIELPANPAFRIIRFFDSILIGFLWLCKQVIPRMQYFNMNEFVANGFDVPWDVSILPGMLVTSSFIIPCVMLGYFALRIRELESK